MRCIGLRSVLPLTSASSTPKCSGRDLSVQWFMSLWCLSSRTPSLQPLQPELGAPHVYIRRISENRGRGSSRDLRPNICAPGWIAIRTTRGVLLLSRVVEGMKPPVVLALLCTSLVNINSDARSTFEGSYWRSSTIATSAVAAGWARTPTSTAGAPVAAAALSSSPRLAAARILRGGGGSSSSSSSNSNSSNGGVVGGGVSTSKLRDGNLEPVSRRGGDAGGSAGEKAADHNSSGGGGLRSDGEASKAAASATAPKQEQKGDAQENALREALILADGPHK